MMWGSGISDAILIIVNHIRLVLQRIPSECMLCERWPVRRFVGVKLAQSSFTWILNSTDRIYKCSKPMKQGS